MSTHLDTYATPEFFVETLAAVEPVDGLVRLDVDLTSAGLHEGGEPEAHGARRCEAHFRNRHWLTF
jgi:hypothetical protein